MPVSEEMVERAAVAIMNRRIQPDFYGVDKNNVCLYDTDKELAKAALTAALSDQAVVPKEATPEMLDSAFVDGPLPMTGLDGSEQAKRERTTVAEIYRAMIEAAPAGTR